MRKLVVVGAFALLTACGDGEDFAVDVAIKQNLAKEELARLDGGMMLTALSMPAITAKQPAADKLSFTLPGEDEDGQVVFRFEDIGAQGTRVHVTVSLPAERATIDGEAMVLDENKAEDVLERDLRAWSKRFAESGYASLDSLNSTLAGMAISVRSDTLESVLEAANDPAALEELVDPAVLADVEAEENADYYADEGYYADGGYDAEGGYAEEDPAYAEDETDWAAAGY